MFRERVYGVLAKIETTSGTDAVPTGAANAVRVIGVPVATVDYLETAMRDDVIFGGLGVLDRTAPAARFVKVDLTLEAKGAGAAYSASVKPESDAFWRASGFSVTTDFTGGAEFYRYQTIDTGMETMTLYLYTANKLLKVVGCVAAPKFNVDALKRGFMTFSCTGKLVADPTEVAVPALTFNAALPPLMHTVATSIGAWTEASGDPLVMRTVGIDFGTEVQDRPSAGATDGLIGFIITNRKPRQTMTVEIPTLTAFDAFAMSKAVGAAQPASAWQIGQSGAPGIYNRVKVVTGRWALEAPGIGSDKGLNTYNLAGNLVANTEAITGREAYIRFD